MRVALGKLADRRDGIVSCVSIGIAALGWLGTRAEWPPLMLVHEPGFELALFLKISRQRLGFRNLAVNELVVFALNVLVWMAILLIGGWLLRAITRAWRRSWLWWAFLVSIAVSAVGEITTYDNYWLPGLPNLSRPGWIVAPRLVPITSFVIDFRTPLGLFAYPDRLITTGLALVINLLFWTVVLYLAALAFAAVQRRSAGNATA